jgi:hypothetical protein
MPFKDPEKRKVFQKVYSRNHYLKNRETIIKRTHEYQVNHPESRRKDDKKYNRKVATNKKIKDFYKFINKIQGEPV